jgi:peptide deformylase
MSILKVARLGHPVLRAKARPVTPDEIKSPAFQTLVDDLFETMTEYSGIGLAGPQVHQGLRVSVAGVRESDTISPMSDDAEMPLVTIVNPEITVVDDARDEAWEGCLSIPDIRGLVQRPVTIKVRALDRHGRRIEIAASGLPARVIQHETDHLDGVLFFDRMKSLETLAFMDEFRRYWSKDDEA